MPKQEFNYLNFVFTTIPGGWVAGESGIKAISAQTTELELD